MFDVEQMDFLIEFFMVFPVQIRKSKNTSCGMDEVMNSQL